MMDGHYVAGRLRPRSLRDAEDVVAGELEYRDVVVHGGVVPGVGSSTDSGTLDYTTAGAARAAFEESLTVHHRRPARRRDGWKERKVRRACEGLARLLWNGASVRRGSSSSSSIGGTEDPPFPRVDVGLGLGRGWGRSISITINLSF